MDRRKLTTILYLVTSLVLALAGILTDNNLLLPLGVIFLILGAMNAQPREDTGT